MPITNHFVLKTNCRIKSLVGDNTVDLIFMRGGDEVGEINIVGIDEGFDVKVKSIKSDPSGEVVCLYTGRL